MRREWTQTTQTEGRPVTAQREGGALHKPRREDTNACSDTFASDPQPAESEEINVCCLGCPPRASRMAALANEDMCFTTNQALFHLMLTTIQLSRDYYCTLLRRKLRSYGLKSHCSWAESSLSGFRSHLHSNGLASCLPSARCRWCHLFFCPSAIWGGRGAVGPLIWRAAVAGSGSHHELVAGMVSQGLLEFWVMVKR